MMIKKPVKPVFRTAKRLIFLLLLVGILFSLWRFFSGSSPSVNKPNNNQTSATRRDFRSQTLPPVQIATVQQRDIPYYLPALGTVTAANTVTVHSLVGGQLMSLHFSEGQKVNVGDLLAEIDPRPYRVQLMQAEGQLATAQATLDNAKRDLVRYQALTKNNLVSQQQLDTQQSLVAQSAGSVKTAQAAVADAQLKLTYSRITAPISGRVGLKLVDVGNIVNPADTNGIVVITQTQPIDVLFALPGPDINTVVQANGKGTPLSVEAWDRDNSALIAEGELLSIDNLIDTATGTVKLKARFNNQNNQLFPNQFVNIQLKVATQVDALVIPITAVQMGNEGRFVWLVDQDNKVSKTKIATSLQHEQWVVVTHGVSVGQKVVTDGVDGLTDGLQVEIVTGNRTDNPPSDNVSANQNR